PGPKQPGIQPEPPDIWIRWLLLSDDQANQIASYLAESHPSGIHDLRPHREAAGIYRFGMWLAPPHLGSDAARDLGLAQAFIPDRFASSFFFIRIGRSVVDQAAH